MNNEHERSPNKTPEQESSQVELDRINAERKEQLKEQLERSPEQAKENLSEMIEKAKDNAETTQEKKQEKAVESKEKSPAEKRVPRKKVLEVSYNKTMKHVQAEMNTPSRTFSKVIHAKPVEKASEVVGSTVARPNAILSGAIFAFVITLVLYLVSRHYGYVLSGFESIGAFIVGWVVGLLYDYLRVLITGKHQ